VASSTLVQPSGTLFHPTFTTLLIPVHSEKDSRMYFWSAYNWLLLALLDVSYSGALQILHWLIDVLMFLTFLQIILDFYRIPYIRMRGLRLLKLSCMRLICCLSVYLLEMVRQHCPVGFLGQTYNQLWTIYAPCDVFFVMCFLYFFLNVFYGLCFPCVFFSFSCTLVRVSW